MDIKLFNTLSRAKEIFCPIKAGRVGLYDCGPTVYDDAHIGNLRSYVFADILRRTFEYNGYDVTQVINITDVGHLTSDADEGEDKMTKALRRLDKPLTLEAMNEVATMYMKSFVADLGRLNIEQPHNLPRASEHIKEDVELVQELEKKGFTYRTTDGLYFNTAKFPEYGKLKGVPREVDKSESRIGINPEKHNPADFVLWKFDPKLGWDSPWGKGFPGWHIECSAMSVKYLGQPFDIHTGGIDHIPVHHPNEMAQSEAAHDKPLANYWMHNAFITIEGGKMAKSAGGFIVLKTLEDQSIAPLAYRYWLLTAHYRSPANFSYEAAKAAQNALNRLTTTISSYDDGGKVIPAYRERFLALINDDLDTPQAIALVWELLKDDGQSDVDKKATILDFDRVLGLKLGESSKADTSDIPEDIKQLSEARERARQNKDWNKADELRAAIEAKGFELKDTPGGVQIAKA